MIRAPQQKVTSKIMRVIFLILLAIFSSLSSAEEFSLIGTWKSDEKKTLNSMNAIAGVTPKARALLEDQFFGKFLVNYSQGEYRYYIPGETDDLEAFNKYYPYKVIGKYSEYIEIESFNSLFDEYEIVRLHLENDCYYIYVTKWNFKEYFCRVE